VFRVAAEGTTGVLEDDSDLTIAGDASTIIYTPKGGTATGPHPLQAHTPTSFKYQTPSITIEGTVTDEPNNKVLVGYAKKPTGTDTDSFGAMNLAEAGSETINDGRFRLSTFRQSGTSLLENRGEILIVTLEVEPGKKKRVIALALKGGSPMLLPTNTTSGPTISERWSEDPNFQVAIRAVPRKLGSPKEEFILVGHVTWTGGRPKPGAYKPPAGEDDADSFTAVRVGPGTLYGGNDGG
jgi:hypothetical protein